MWADWLHHPCRFGGSPTLRSGGHNQRWATCGRIGYITPAVWGPPNSSEQGTNQKAGSSSSSSLSTSASSHTLFSAPKSPVPTPLPFHAHHLRKERPLKMSVKRRIKVLTINQ